MKKFVAKVELYNKIGKINGVSCAVGNGFAVARFELIEGVQLPRRMERLIDCGTAESSEGEARDYAAEWNEKQRRNEKQRENDGNED